MKLNYKAQFQFVDIWSGSMSSFWALSKYFSGKMAQTPLKNGHTSGYTYGIKKFLQCGHLNLTNCMCMCHWTYH